MKFTDKDGNTFEGQEVSWDNLLEVVEDLGGTEVPNHDLKDQVFITIDDFYAVFKEVDFSNSSIYAIESGQILTEEEAKKEGYTWE